MVCYILELSVFEFLLFDFIVYLYSVIFLLSYNYIECDKRYIFFVISDKS